MNVIYTKFEKEHQLLAGIPGYDEQCSYITAEDSSGEILGAAGYQIQDNCMYLFSLYVRPESRNQGIGRRLLYETWNYAARQEIPEIMLYLLIEDGRQEAFFERVTDQGFVMPQFGDRMYRIKASELAKSKIMAHKMGEDNPHIRKADARDARKCIAMMADVLSQNYSENEIGNFEADYSYVIEGKDKNINGFLLVDSQGNGDLAVRAGKLVSKAYVKDYVAMLQQIILTIREKAAPSCEVIITSINEQSRRMIEGVLEGLSYHVCVDAITCKLI